MSVSFELTGKKLKSGVKEASDVVALPGGRFAIVSDTSDRLAVVDARGQGETFKLEGLKDGKSQLEGVAYDPVRHHLFVVREEAQELRRYTWHHDKDAAPRLEKTFEVDRAGPKNKGVEGIVFVPADLSPTGRAQLLLAKEGNPRELWMHEGTGRPRYLVTLEREVHQACSDFSGLAVDPVTGVVFISSDESAVCAQIKLVFRHARVVGKFLGSFPLRDARGKALRRVEGITFDEGGDLLVLTEDDGVLRRFARQE